MADLISFYIFKCYGMFKKNKSILQTVFMVSYCVSNVNYRGENWNIKWWFHKKISWVILDSRPKKTQNPGYFSRKFFYLFLFYWEIQIRHTKLIDLFISSFALQVGQICRFWQAQSRRIFSVGFADFKNGTNVTAEVVTKMTSQADQWSLFFKWYDLE